VPDLPFSGGALARRRGATRPRLEWLAGHAAGLLSKLWLLTNTWL